MIFLRILFMFTVIDPCTLDRIMSLWNHLFILSLLFIVIIQVDNYKDQSCFDDVIFFT